MIKLGESDRSLKEELEIHLSEINEKVLANAAVESRVEAIEQSMRDVTKLIEQFNTRLAAPDDVKRQIIPLTDKEWQSFGMKAVHQMPVPVTPKYERGRLIGFNEPAGDPVRTFHEACDKVYMWSILKGINPETHPDAVQRLPLYRSLLAPRMNEIAAVLKATNSAFDATTAGEGGDWVPTAFSGTYWEKVRTALRIAPLFMYIPMPQSPYVLPLWINDLIPYAFGESIHTDSEGLTLNNMMPGTPISKRTMTAYGIGGFTAVSRQLQEEAIIAMLNLLEIAGIYAMRKGIDDAMLNGDQTNLGVAAANQDNDIAGKWDIKKALDGLRKTALGVAACKQDASAATLTSSANWNDHVIGGRKRLKQYNEDPSQIALIVGTSTNMNLMQNPDFRTAAALAGVRSTIQTGTLQSEFGAGFRPDGMQYVVSGLVREDVASTGVNTVGGPNTLTTCILTNVNAWVWGSRREITMQVLKEKYALTDQDGVVFTTRVAFTAPVANATADPHTVIIHNVTP